MGVETHVLLDHALPWGDLVRLPTLLEDEWRKPKSPLRALPAPVDPGRYTWRWRLDPTFSSAGEQLFDQGDISFESPSGLAGSALRSALVLSPFVTWWAFLRQPDLRRAVLAASKRVAEIVHASLLVYVPDNAYRCSRAGDMLYKDGATVPEAVRWLRAECGKPAETPDEIFRDDGHGWSGDGYMVSVVGAAGEREDAADEGADTPNAPLRS